MPFRSRWEQFLVLHVAPAGIEAHMLGVDADKNLALLGTIPYWKPRRKDRPSLFSPSCKTVVAVDSSLAFFAREPMRLFYSRKKREVNANELENALSQAVQKIVALYRPKAAEVLGVSDLDTTVVTARALGFSLDGMPTDYPPGKETKKLDVDLEVGFTTRAVFEALQPLFGREDFFFTGTGKAELSSLERAHGGRLNFIMFEPGKGGRFFVSPRGRETAMRQGDVTAHPSTVIRAIAETWNLGPRALHDVTSAYMEGRISSRIEALFAGTVQTEQDLLRTELYKKKLEGPVYLYAHEPIPYFSNIRTRAAHTESVNVEAILSKLGFTLSKEDVSTYAAGCFRIIAPFLECYFDASNAEISHWLMRRIHWIRG